MKIVRVAAITGILAAAFALTFHYFTSQVVADPKLTLGQMRALLPESVRPIVWPANEGSQLAQKASEDCKDRDVKAGSTLEFHEWKNVDDALVTRAEAYLKPKQKGFTEAAKAVSYPNWNHAFLPESTVPTYQLLSQDFPVFAYLKGMSKQLVIQSRVDAYRHRTSAAVDDLITARRLGERVSASPGSFVWYMIGAAMKWIPDAEILRLAANKEVSSADLKRLATVVGEDKPLEEFASAMRAQLWESELIQVGATADPVNAKPEDYPTEVQGHPNPIDRKATVVALGKLFQKRIDGMTLPWKDQPDVTTEIRMLTSALPKAWVRSFSGANLTESETAEVRSELRSVKNPLGLQTISMSVTVLGQDAAKAAFSELQRQRMTVLSLLCTAYFRENGHWPKDLSEVRGTNLDPLSGTPFNYDSVKGTIGSGVKSEKTSVWHIAK